MKEEIREQNLKLFHFTMVFFLILFYITKTRSTEGDYQSNTQGPAYTIQMWIQELKHSKQTIQIKASRLSGLPRSHTLDCVIECTP